MAFSGSVTIALVIPTHNRPEYVTQAVESALRQERPFDQVIVVPDGLDDPAGTVLHDLPVEVQPIARSGVAAARNTGVALAHTDWVCFLDDDDLLHPAFSSDLENAIARFPETAAFNAPHWIFGDAGDVREEFAATSLDECLTAVESVPARNDMNYLDITGRSYDALLARFAGTMSPAAVRADTLRQAGGFPEGLVAAEDWTMYVNVSRLTEWRVLPERRAFVRTHASNASSAVAPERSISVLRAIRSFWAPTSLPTPAHRPLSAYGRNYRNEVRVALADARRSRDRAARSEAIEIAREILPRRWDRVYARAPRLLRSVMWRLERGTGPARRRTSV